MVTRVGVGVHAFSHSGLSRHIGVDGRAASFIHKFSPVAWKGSSNSLLKPSLLSRLFILGGGVVTRVESEGDTPK